MVLARSRRAHYDLRMTVGRRNRCRRAGEQVRRAAALAASVLWFLALTVIACTKTTGTELSPDAAEDAAGTATDASGSGSGPTCTRVPEAGACGKWPASADTFDDASKTGCLPRPVSLVCEVPSGSTVNGADGAVYGPDGAMITPDCCDQCELTEYALTCGFDAQPDPSLGCHGVMHGTPGAHPYCCPCLP